MYRNFFVVARTKFGTSQTPRRVESCSFHTTKLYMQDDVITRSLAMFDCALWSPANDEPPATTVSNTTPPTPLSTTTFSQSLSPSPPPPPPSYSLLPPIPPPLPSQPPPGYTVQDQELYLLLAAHWWNQPEAPLFCWRWISWSALDFSIPERNRGKAFSANRHFSNIVPVKIENIGIAAR